MIEQATSASAATTPTTGSSASSRSQFEEQYDTFLQLLTVQLRNQDPTDPLDTNEFTEQIVSYTSLEQQIQTNQQISDLVDVVSGFVSSNAISYVGDVVSFASAQAELENGRARWDYNNSRSGDRGAIEIRDSSGEVVRTDAAATGIGSHSYVWDGKTDSGDTAPDGPYSISVIVRDENDTAINVETTVFGLVDAVDLSTPTPELIVGAQRLSLGDIRTVVPGPTS